MAVELILAFVVLAAACRGGSSYSGVATLGTSTSTAVLPAAIADR
jgi:hypothetical protein